MPPSNLLAALEALLFSSDEPLSLTLLSEALEAEPAVVAAGLQELGAQYRERGAGVDLREIAGGHLLVTCSEHAEAVGRLLRGRKRVRLSRAALETMAIIAYKQPVTKVEIEAIRGVDSGAVLTTLLERNLITIRGRSKVVGRPLLYGTTPEFLDYFGLKDLTELPRPEELRALVAAREPEQLDMIELGVPEGGAVQTIRADADSPRVESDESPELAEAEDEDEEFEEVEDEEFEDEETEDEETEDEETEDEGIANEAELTEVEPGPRNSS